MDKGFFYASFKSKREVPRLPVEYYHTHDGIQILYVYEGDGHLILDDQFYAVHSRTLIIFKPYQLHFLRMEPSSHYICSLFKVKTTFLDHCERLLPQCHSIISGFLKHSDNQQVFTLNESQHFRLDQVFEHLRENLREEFKHLHDEVVMLFLFRFFVDLKVSVMPDLAGGVIKPLRTTRPISEILRWIDTHYRENCTLNRIAEELHLSVQNMSRSFRRQTGKSIGEYIAEKRLEQSRLLLHTSTLSVDEISAETGFNSASYFIRVFKNKYGITPHQYRLSISKMYGAKELNL